MGYCSGCGSESNDLTEVKQSVPMTCDCGEDDCYVCGDVSDEPWTETEDIVLTYCPPCHETIVIQHVVIEAGDPADVANELLGE